MQPVPSESSGRRGLILLLLAVVGEYLILSVAFDASPWLIHVGLFEQLRGVKYIGPALLASIAGVFALGGSSWVKAVVALAAARPEPSVQRLLVAAHVILFCALYALSLHIFVPPFKVATNAGLWISAWTLLGALTIGCLFAAFIDVKAIGRLLRQNIMLVAGAGILTALAWQAGTMASTFWHHTSRPMMRLLDMFARTMFEGGHADVEKRVLATSRFAVEIAPACSGYEGIGLILVFLGGFLFIARDRLMFPKVLIVLPIGVVFVWVANLIRIVGLTAVGHWVSPTIAVNGFHAYAGWILFCATALTMVYWTEGKFAVAHERHVAKTFDTPTTAYVGPMLALIAASLVTGLFATDIDLFYFVRILAAGAVLWLFRGYYADLRGMPSVISIVIGLVIAAFWMVVVKPPEGGVSPLGLELDKLSPASRALWITGRLIGFIVVVPIVEELAFRGHLLRWIQARDFEKVPTKQWNVQAVLVSSLLFGAIHADLIAGTMAGILFAFASLHRGKLIDAIAAHSVANAVLAVVGLARGAYWLW
jgi:exosortase E/protease (VPEID-CTERM system)